MNSINLLNEKKASSPDKIILKINSETVATILQMFFFQLKMYLNSKKETSTVCTKPANYRPVCLTSAISRILDHIVHSINYHEALGLARYLKWEPTCFFMPPKELWEAYSNRTVRPTVSPSVRPSVRPSRFRVRSISPIFFEVGIPNLVCGYILGWRSVAYQFLGYCDLDLWPSF